MQRYKYYNRNPKGLHQQDCVCKAISTVTGLRYGAVDKLLDITAERYKCDKLCVCCYNHLLEDILEYHKEKCYFEKTVEEVAAQYPYNKLIIRIKSHLTSAINGIVLDIWDCSDEFVDCFWIVS